MAERTLTHPWLPPLSLNREKEKETKREGEGEQSILVWNSCGGFKDNRKRTSYKELKKKHAME